MSKELASNDIESIKNRLQGRPYQSHNWKPLGASLNIMGERGWTTAQCILCNETVESYKDWCDSEGLIEFWNELEKRRDCPRRKPVIVKFLPPLHPNCRNINVKNIRNISIIGITADD